MFASASISNVKVHFGLLAVAMVLGRQVAAQTLYDGSAGTLPTAQGWNYITSPLFGAKATTAIEGLSVSVDTTPVIGDSAGYFSSLPPFFPKHPLVGVLDRTNGFSLTFDSTLVSEAHSTTNRAGFSVIVLASDSLGIELGFWEDQIWAQDDGGNLFFHAESVNFDTKARASYQLSIKDETYNLSTNGVSVLTGKLRNYKASGAPTPYTVPSFIFLGDDTSRASAKFQLATVVLEKNVAPSRFEMVGLGQNGLELGISGPTGPAYYLETSEDLTHWSVLRTLSGFNGIATLAEGLGVTNGMQFYRVRAGGDQ